MGYDSNQMATIAQESQLLKDAGLKPDDVLRMTEEELNNTVVVIADDINTLAHELYLHARHYLKGDGVKATSTEQDHIFGHGKKAYSKGLNPILSPTVEDVDPNSEMGIIYRKIEKVSTGISKIKKDE